METTILLAAVASIFFLCYQLTDFVECKVVSLNQKETDYGNSVCSILAASICFLLIDMGVLLTWIFCLES